MLEQLKKDVCAANLALVKQGLVVLTWGNVSGIDRARGIMVIKPSGASYDTMTPDQMVVVDMVLPSGVQIQGVKPGEDVGIAYGEADEAGNFKGEVPVTAKLNTLFRVGWTPIMSIDPKTLNPIPPGVYTIKASGTDSGALATTTLEFVAPIKK